jgi:hypothetical protein
MHALLFVLLALPTFDQYKVEVPEHVSVAKSVRTNSADAKRYKTVLTDALKGGPNFAGTYTLARVGCGSSCNWIAIIDTKSGAVVSPGFTLSFANTWIGSDEPVEFRRDSALVILRGCLNENDKACGVYAMKWDGKKLQTLETVPKSD